MKNLQNEKNINNSFNTEIKYSNEESDIEGIVSLFEEHEIEDDELDLIKLVSTDANNSNQYLLFLGSDNQYYAQNVAKIEELLVFKDLDIIRNHDKDNVIFGTANIRGKSTTIIFFDQWMESEILSDELYELVILSSYGGKRFAMVVKKVEDIVSIDANNMVNNSSDNLKSSFVSHIKVNGLERMCTIFDGDMLLMNVFNDSIQKNLSTIENMKTNIKSDKIILFADDSHFIRKMVEKLFIQLGFSYKIFDDGEGLINKIQSMKKSDISLVITDLEMPKAGGKEVIDFMRNDKKFDDINIIVHTNMSNSIMDDSLSFDNVSKVIRKVDMLTLTKAINRYMK